MAQRKYLVKWSYTKPTSAIFVDGQSRIFVDDYIQETNASMTAEVRFENLGQNIGNFDARAHVDGNSNLIVDVADLDLGSLRRIVMSECLADPLGNLSDSWVIFAEVLLDDPEGTGGFGGEGG